ncbi:Protein of unknown function [Escherichia coli]|nr:Protein of unknown function [Escherichia coli]CDU38831.1 Protein of unknown function [Escherichia coli]
MGTGVTLVHNASDV